jgi:two-component system chemotaxis response regulator CheY
MKKMLIVDDSSYMRDVIKLMISGLDIEVVAEANNGRDGVEQYKRHTPDIVLMDFYMDQQNGLEALEQIIQHDPNAVVIMISSSAKQILEGNEALSLGAKQVFKKPIDKLEFIDYLQGLINS